MGVYEKNELFFCMKKITLDKPYFPFPPPFMNRFGQLLSFKRGQQDDKKSWPKHGINLCPWQSIQMVGCFFPW